MRAQLDAWCAGVQTRLKPGEAPSEQRVRDGVRRQTVIWRQLLAGDKAPEAYLDGHARAGLRDDLRAADLAALPALDGRARRRRCSRSRSRSRT